MERPLDFVGVRVLGALIEKELTTPDYYPLTLNALTAACNQKSNRDPVLELDESAVSKSLDDLGRRGLVRPVHRSDTRAMRYRQELSAAMSLHPAETAVMCVLMLRGAQTVGEIRTRAARLFAFGDLAQVEITLNALMTLPEPLVAQLPRQPGRKEARYAHLLAGEPPADAVVENEPADAVEGGRIDALEEELASLRGEVAQLRERLEELVRAFQ